MKRDLATKIGTWVSPAVASSLVEVNEEVIREWMAEGLVGIDRIRNQLFVRLEDAEAAARAQRQTGGAACG